MTRDFLPIMTKHVYPFYQLLLFHLGPTIKIVGPGFVHVVDSSKKILLFVWQIFKLQIFFNLYSRLIFVLNNVFDIIVQLGSIFYLVFCVVVNCCFTSIFLCALLFCLGIPELRLNPSAFSSFEMLLPDLLSFRCTFLQGRLLQRVIESLKTSKHLAFILVTPLSP